MALCSSHGAATPRLAPRSSPSLPSASRDYHTPWSGTLSSINTHAKLLLSKPHQPLNASRPKLFLVAASIQKPRGFDPSPPKKIEPKTPKVEKIENDSDFDFTSNASDEVDDGVPEEVTNRILRRLIITVGGPLFVGLATFPLFYWLKVVQKFDLPEWVPFITSIVCFGTAGLGISYGVISASWDPAREGTLLGLKEVKANWPVIMQNFNKK